MATARAQHAPVARSSTVRAESRKGCEMAQAARRTSICYRCRKAVIWAVIRNRRGGTRPIAIEPCAPGAGDVAIAPELFGDVAGGPLVELVSNGTAFRAHAAHCPRARRPPPLEEPAREAFSARSFRGKVRP